MAAELNDQEFGSSSESRWTAQFTGIVPGIVQQKFEKFDTSVLALMFMVVTLALVFWMLRIAGRLVLELSQEEYYQEVVEEENPAPPLFVAPAAGRKFHAFQRCRGLRNAGTTRPVDPCFICCPENLLARERRKTTHRRMFVTVPGKFLWIKLWATLALLSMSAALLWKAYRIEQLIAPDLFVISQEQVRQALTDGNPGRMSQESSGDASPSGDESDITDLMSVHVFRKPNARKVHLRNMVLLEIKYQDILRYVLMILASVDKIVAYVQENMFALHEVISGLSLGPAEYDLHHRNRGYGPVMTVIQENSFSASLCIFALTSYGMITWIAGGDGAKGRVEYGNPQTDWMRAKTNLPVLWVLPGVMVWELNLAFDQSAPYDKQFWFRRVGYAPKPGQCMHAVLVCKHCRYGHTAARSSPGALDGLAQAQHSPCPLLARCRSAG